MTLLRLIGTLSIHVLVVLGALLSSSCDPLSIFDRIDIYIKNCSMDNIRIIGAGTNLHLERDENCRDDNKQYLVSLDTTVSTKLFQLDRSVGGCQALLDIELTDYAIKSFTDKSAVGCGDINITLRENPSGVFKAECSDSECLKAIIQDCP